MPHTGPSTFIALRTGGHNHLQKVHDAHVTGSVTLRAKFSSSGIVTDIVVVSGLPKGLTEEAIEAGKTVIFIPAEKDGKPVSQILEMVYSFNLSP